MKLGKEGVNGKGKVEERISRVKERNVKSK
jgi:hypothetical protein